MNDSPEPCAERESAPHGTGWLSGASVSTEQVPVGHVCAGDRLILDDGTVAEVDDIRHGWYRFPEGHEPGVALGWKAVQGPTSGLMFRKGSDLVHRVARDG